MVLSEYAKIRIPTLWSEGDGPTVILRKLKFEGIKTTMKTLSLFISRYVGDNFSICLLFNVY